MSEEIKIKDLIQPYNPKTTGQNYNWYVASGTRDMGKYYATSFIEQLQQENKQLKEDIDNVLEMVCCIEHNLDKYEEVGLDHFDYAQRKVIELKDYLLEILRGKE